MFNNEKRKFKYIQVSYLNEKSIYIISRIIFYESNHINLLPKSKSIQNQIKKLTKKSHSLYLIYVSIIDIFRKNIIQ